MLAAGILSLVYSYWPVLLVVWTVTHVLRNKYHQGLHKYPGPALGAYTNWWRYYDVLARRAEKTHVNLHARYGDVVRLGPNVLSFADPRAIKTIYGLNKKMSKSDFYPVQQAVAKGERLQSLFSTKDEEYHARYRRCVNNAFSMSSLVNYEPLVDSTMDVFVKPDLDGRIDCWLISLPDLSNRRDGATATLPNHAISLAGFNSSPSTRLAKSPGARDWGSWSATRTWMVSSSSWRAF